jgi:Ca2+:H+ antiporter
LQACSYSTPFPYRRWFGIVLLPFASFSADGVVAVVFFIRTHARHFYKPPEESPELLAEALAIDMSIQFLLFWMPLVTLLGWWVGKPMSMFFGKQKLPSHLAEKVHL